MRPTFINRDIGLVPSSARLNMLDSGSGLFGLARFICRVAKISFAAFEVSAVRQQSLG